MTTATGAVRCIPPRRICNFKGNCLEAFRFYADTFGGRIVFAMTYGESPAAAHTPPDSRDKIIHARLNLGSHFILGCDAPADRYQAPQGFSVMAAVQEPEEAERVFKPLGRGRHGHHALRETFWAQGFGMCTDRFGTPWMVNCAKPMDGAAQQRTRA